MPALSMPLATRPERSGRAISLAAHILLLGGVGAAADSIPLPEHPRPDFERADWINLNGPWSLRFDRGNTGEKESWFAGGLRSFPKSIVVPFPWGSKLSGVADEADIAWYARTVRIPEAWRGKRIFLVVGAADWHTTGWLDGKPIGNHRGGYTPFELELTPHAAPGRDQTLVLRIDDTPHPFKLEGKQGYGPARGIWQTVYLEARPSLFIDTVHFHPDPDHGKVGVGIRLSEPAPVPVRLEIRTDAAAESAAEVRKGDQETAFTLALPGARRWSLEDPHLHHAEVVLGGGVGKEDRVKTYFGMRKVSVERLPGSGHAYIALNSRPVYLQLALDQAYHPDGWYTYPSDEFVRDEILCSLRIGLNGIRIHVKIDPPRKLYWADRLGLLVMADVPNSWGEPDEEMRRETETALRGMIRRDFNHPSIFSWVVFNETWGLKTGKEYLASTQEWVGSMYRLAKSLDPTRLVEDNSPCNLDHVETDINTWHKYLGGHEWREHLDQVVRDTHPGSKWNYIGGRVQAEAPLLNSECGNVWGYEGSTGDVDWSWDYHVMLNEFRRHPKICGWLYTEHHDVINEWNGYFKFDRSPKVTGLGALVPGMSLRDLHGPFYIAPGGEMCAAVKPAEKVRVPLWASFLTDARPAGGLTLRAELHGVDSLGREELHSRSARSIEFEPWLSRELEPLEVEMPDKRAVAVVRLILEDGIGRVLHRNFTTFAVGEGGSPRDETVAAAGGKARVLRIAPSGFRSAEWSLGKWDVLDGLKVNGAGSGHFEYAVPWPEGLDPARVKGATFIAELSSKQLFTKDRKHATRQEGDFMRGKGTHDPSLNPNSYPMTDTVPFASRVHVRVSGESAGAFDLADDPADHRGILSWHSQLRDRKLREAGSYGYLVSAPIPPAALRAAAAAWEIVIRLEVDPSLPGGLAVYGERFGRYPVDPSIVLAIEE
jgi:hypothetical protein